MSNNNRKAIQSSVWYTIANFLTRSIGFITTPIFTRLLSKSEFGDFNNYTSWLSIITIFITLNLESTLISARYDYKDDFDEYIFSILTLSTVSVGLWFLIINFFENFVESILGLSRLHMNIMLVYLLFLPAINLFQARERYCFEYKITVLTSLILSVGTAFVSVLFVTKMNDKLTGRIIGSVIPTIVLGIYFYIFFLKHGKVIKIKYWKYAIIICLPYIPHLLSMSLLNSTDRVMINRWCGSESTALYSLAYSCGAIVTLLLNSLNSAFSPWLAEKLSENKKVEIREFSKVYIFAFLFLTIGIMLVSPEILLILGGKSYIESMYVMTPVSMGCVCQFIYTLFVNVEQFKKKTIGMAIASLIAALTNFLLNLFFIPKFGYLSAAYTTLVGYLILLIIHMYLVKRMNMDSVYDYRFIAIIVGIGIVIMFGVSLLYSYPLVRRVFVIVYVLIFAYVVLKNIDIIKRMLKK